MAKIWKIFLVVITTIIKGTLAFFYAIYFSIKMLFVQHDKIEHFAISFGIATYFNAIGLMNSYLWAFFIGAVKEVIDFVVWIIFGRKIWIFGHVDGWDIIANFYGVFSALLVIEIGTKILGVLH